MDDRTAERQAVVTAPIVLHKMNQSDLLNRQAIVMPGYHHYLNPTMGDTFISSFVLPSVPSFLILASWAF